MPNITAVVWNIQTFGDTMEARRGTAYAPLCCFIGRVLAELNADVFVLMELRSGGRPYLPTLLAVLNFLLNNGWQYDYIPGSIVEGVQGIPQAANNLGFTQMGHSEGYAVFWRNDANKFTMRPASRTRLSGHPIANQSYINLVFEGRTPANVDAQTEILTAPNFNPLNNNPNLWGNLGFTQNSPMAELRPLRWDKVRRPCYCVLDLAAGGARRDQLLPIVVYHAPSPTGSMRFPGTFIGVQASALSRQLYQVDDTNQPNPTPVNVNQAVVAGDFNLDRNGNNQAVLAAYNAYTENFNAGNNNNEGGAQLPNILVNDQQNAANNLTAVRLSRSDGTPILGPNTTDYFWLAIDNLFYRNLNLHPPAQGAVYNVLSDLIGDPLHGVYGALVDTTQKRRGIKAFNTALEAALHPLDGSDPYPEIARPSDTPCKKRQRLNNGQMNYTGLVLQGLEDYDNYKEDLENGYFSNARRAAEFYVNSVSDHLPVVFRFTI